ncbi:hypothetical protein, partial [Pseudomonas sp. WC2]|uniref:hypothetical protein n=1 Tax=Pseudomonas sp. WC2 TaxID=3424773 RepID=UPI003D33973A
AREKVLLVASGLRSTTSNAPHRAIWRGFFYAYGLGDAAIVGQENLKDWLQRTLLLADNSLGDFKVARNHLIAFGRQLSSARLK